MLEIIELGTGHHHRFAGEIPAVKIGYRKRHAVGADEQIGAFQELETAEDAWNAARRRFADIMQGKAANIRQVDIPGRGTWYRVRIGPYDGRQAADVACTDLKERGQDCLVVAP